MKDDDSDDEIKSVDQAAIDARNNLEALRATLASTADRQFLLAIWALRALQSDRHEQGKRFLRRVPNEALSSEMTSKFAHHPWELETLINEKLSNPIWATYLTQNPSDWNQLAAFTSLLRDIEGDEYLTFNDPDKIIDYMFRIAARQFEWQQGFVNKQHFFRSTFIYGMGECATFFEEKHGISVNTFSLTCFAYISKFFQSPTAASDLDLTALGVSAQERDAAIALVSRPLRELQSMARSERRHDNEIAFKPSLIRQYPIIRWRKNSRMMTCPLPELLANRMTFGIFYDVIDGGGPIRNEIGKRFEAYCKLIIEKFIPELNVLPEYTYSTNFGERKSPDLLLKDRMGQVTLCMECKAARISMKSRYTDFSLDDRGYGEMVKAISQIWRYAADCRRNKSRENLAPNPIGTVLTFDGWFLAAGARQKAVLDAAMEHCSSKFPEIEEEDRLPVSFVYMPEFERALSVGDKQTILDALRANCETDRLGYSFDHVHEDLVGDTAEERGWPFDELLGEVLPWWAKMNSMKGRERQSG